ncbi:hypothetical protein HYH03_007808 [Edaphochlamys debaryana]|uniref:Uncharacterized protein n=1 Tax=Edaphochlamys debaryana TaxID=47281 RepID=A0A836BYR9_9CHLO|nr:hypothetical protein HYH03_007808 [Edaphochlamys debaryana]|eukprot:KAG2493870.1 hypothetical protein HYH03_007808 [Edaphochlamys debaryana]
MSKQFRERAATPSDVVLAAVVGLRAAASAPTSATLRAVVCEGAESSSVAWSAAAKAGVGSTLRLLTQLDAPDPSPGTLADCFVFAAHNGDLTTLEFLVGRFGSADAANARVSLSLEQQQAAFAHALGRCGQGPTASLAALRYLVAGAHWHVDWPVAQAAAIPDDDVAIAEEMWGWEALRAWLSSRGPRAP